jgi:hypothetical protein
LDAGTAERSFQIRCMPVTARLLQRLHESLGDDTTNDLFAWWEEAATVNRAAVREVADLYFARFEARLEKGLAEVRSEVDKGLSEVRSEMDKGFSKVRSEIDARLANQRADLVKWMFLFWIITLVPLAGLMIALSRR